MLQELHPRLSGAAREFLQGPHKLLIEGAWVDPFEKSCIDVYDPATGRVIAQVAEGRAADIDRAVRAARKAFSFGDWPAMKPRDRTAVMYRLAELIERDTQVLSELDSMESGKPLAVAVASLRSTIGLLRYTAEWASRLGGEEVPISSSGEWHAFTTREPVGVVGQIIPWNFPLTMAIMKLSPALVTGCTVVLKPAEQTPLAVLRLGRLLQEAGIPAGVVNIINGLGSNAGAALAAHPGVDKIAFTGSTATGKRIVAASVGNLKRVSLELGGKSPVFIFPDADLELAAAGAANAIFFNSGQVCAAGSRLYIHKKHFDRVVADVADHGAKLRLGHGLDEGTQLGPLVSGVQRSRVLSMIDAGLEAGARIVGEVGDTPTGDGYFVAPRVFVDTSPDMSIFREEIFGPVVCAMPFGDDDLDALAEQANASAYGLVASIWTQNLGVAHKLARRIRAGNVAVNAHIIVDPEMPFGGYRQSGWGRERGREVLELYTEVKSVAMKLS